MGAYFTRPTGGVGLVLELFQQQYRRAIILLFLLHVISFAFMITWKIAGDWWFGAIGILFFLIATVAFIGLYRYAVRT